MPAAIINFVDIDINVTAGQAEKFSFGSLLGVFEQDIDFARQSGPYFSLSEVVAAGFTSVAAPEVYNWANTVFSQDDGVDQILIGRRIPAAGGPVSQAWQVDESGAPDYVDMTDEMNSATAADLVPFPVAEAVDDVFQIGSNEPFSKVTFDSTGGTQGVDGTVAWEYWNGSAWTAVAGLSDATAGFTAALGAGQIVSFTLPNDWVPLSINGSDPLYYLQARVTQVYTTNPVLTSGTVGGDATWTVTMDAVEAYDPESWYITDIEARDNTAILAVAAWHESRDKIFMPQTSSVALLNGTAGNIGLLLQALGYNNTALWYHDDNTEYLDGAISSSGGGLNLDVPGGVGVWAYRTLEGVPFDTVSSTQAANIYAANANLNGRNLGLSFTSKGTMASGRFIDITTTIHWLTRRMQEAVLSLFVSTPTKIPYTDGGINQVVSVVQGVLNSGVTFGHFSPDFPPVVTAPRIQDVSAANKEARTLQLSASAVFAGAIQKLELTVNLSF